MRPGSENTPSRSSLSIKRFDAKLDVASERLNSIVQAEHFALKEFVPIRVAQIGGNDGGDFGVAHVEEFKEGVDLFGFQGQITQFVNLC
jgi:hypothetical protein